MKRLLLIAVFLLLSLAAGAGIDISGRITEADTGEPLPGAVVTLDRDALWAVTDGNGAFTLRGVQPGTYALEVSLLGYASVSGTLSVAAKGITLDGKSFPLNKFNFELSVSSLALEEVVVTAERAKDNINTTRTLGRAALDHLQMSGVGNVAALLPGGKTVNPDLTAQTELSLRGGGQSAGNAAFSTAVEVNGVRMGDNASFAGLSGVDTRALQVENIESVEVLTGVPSAEYGDLGSGMVRIITKKGRTPLNLSFSVNPRTYDAGLSKGVEVGKGVLNLSAQWTRATQKLSSPYTSYTRRGFTAEYSVTFRQKLRLEAGLTGNVGGMDAKDDPDAFSQERTRARDNLLTPHLKATLLLNRSWVTNLSLEASLYYHDQRSREHLYNSYASSQPAVHAEEQGYFPATALPTTFYADRVTDSRELDAAASFKYDWLHHFGPVKSSLKAGFQWKADGNVGEGEYYEDPSLAASGYRPRPYTDYPYMHTFSVYAEDNLTVPMGPKTKLDLSLGLRGEGVYIRDAQYDKLRTLSPRLNARLHLGEALSVRAGWGITRKLPSFYILYPKQEYRDIRCFGVSYGAESRYVYYTLPYTLARNPELQWQSNHNTEVGIDFEKGGWSVSLAAFRNLTRHPYEFTDSYQPFSYRQSALPDGFIPAADPEMRVDSQTGVVYLRDAEGYYVPMDVTVTDRSFINTRTQSGGATVTRTGLELTVDAPEIRPVRTRLRLDASYTHSRYLDTEESAYYQAGWSHPSLANRSYPYVGIYAGPHALVQGRKTDWLDANLTAITHIPAARLVVTCRVEATLLRSAQNLSTAAYTVSDQSLTPTGGDIYDGDAYTAVAPVAWLDLDGNRHAWTAAEAADPDFQRLILRSGNRYTFAAEGYDPYLSANLSLTKEIGKSVSLSFFANNFTAARPWRKNWATGVSALFTPAFYYGLTCRIKL